MGPAESDVLDPPSLFDQDEAPVDAAVDLDGELGVAVESAGTEEEPAPSATRWRIPAVFAAAGFVALVAAVWSFVSGPALPTQLTQAELRQTTAAANAAGAAGKAVLGLHAGGGSGATGSTSPVIVAATQPTVPASAAPNTAPTPSVTAPARGPISSPPAVTRPSSPALASVAPPPAALGGGGGNVPPQVAQVATEIIAAVDRQSNGRVDIPTTDDNIALLAQWMANEGGLWADNPLNTSLDSSRYPHQFTSDGVDTGIPIFPTMADGVNATATTLLSSPAYRKILNALSSGSTGCLAFAGAVIHSPWASSHYHNDAAAFCGASPGAALTPGNRHGHHGAGHGGHGSGHKGGGTGTHKPKAPAGHAHNGTSAG